MSEDSTKPRLDDLTNRYLWDCEQTAANIGEIVAQLELLVSELSDTTAAAEDKVAQYSLRVAAHALWLAVVAKRGEIETNPALRILERARVILAGMPPNKVSDGTTSEATRRHLAMIAIDGWFGNALLQGHLSRPRKFPNPHAKEKSLCGFIDRILESNVVGVQDDGAAFANSEGQLDSAAAAIEKWTGNGKWEAVNDLLRWWGLSVPAPAGKRIAGTKHPLAKEWNRARELRDKLSGA
jgi:hypothetical protein